MSIGPKGEHTEFPEVDDKTPLRASRPSAPTYSNQLRYKTASSLNFTIQAIFSSLRALFARLFFGQSKQSLEIKNHFTVITNEPSPEVDKVTSAAKGLITGLRNKPADIALTEAQKLREDSALALFNMGFFKAVVENYADWQTEGTPREGEVFQRAYDALISKHGKDFDDKVGQLLLSKADVRYPDRAERNKEKLFIGKTLITNNYNKALKALDTAISATADASEKERLGHAKEDLEKAFEDYQNDDIGHYNKLLDPHWQRMNALVEDTPAADIMKAGFVEPPK